MPPSSGKLSLVLAAFETTIQRNTESSVSDGSYLSSGSRRRRRPQDGKPVPEPEGEKPFGRTSGKYQRQPHVSPSTSPPTSRRQENSPRTRSPRTIACSKLDDVSQCSPTEQTDASSVQFEQSPPRPVHAKLPNSLKDDVSGGAAQTAGSHFGKDCRKRLNSSLPSVGNLPNCDFSYPSLPVILPKANTPIHYKEPFPLQTKCENRPIADPVKHEKTRHYPKSPLPCKGKIHALKDFDGAGTLLTDTANTASDDASERSIYTLDPNHHAVKPALAKRYVGLSPSPSSRFQHQSPTRYEYEDPVALLKSKSRPRGILLRRNHEINTRRHVQFLDLQPGGGRRMSLGQTSKDSLPQRPRRSSLTLQYAPSSSDTGKLAATKIQASYRGYVQWKQTRVFLLEQKLQRIVREHQNELKAITERKWKEMDALRNEAVEEEKRLDSQVELASKLIEHLKRDSAMIKDQTKKLKEHCKTLQHSNLHCEKMAQMQSESIAAMNQNLEQLQKRQDELRATERKCSSKIKTRTTNLSATSQDVKREFQSKMRLKNITGIMCKTLRQRCRDDNLVGLVSELASSNTVLDNAKTAKLNNSDSRAAVAERDGNLSHRSLQHSLHDRSVVSDITESPDAGRSSRDKRERTGVSRSSSFAEYDPNLIVPQLMKTIVEE